MWARTGCSVESRARVIKRASLNFLLRNVLSVIYKWLNYDYRGRTTRPVDFNRKEYPQTALKAREPIFMRPGLIRLVARDMQTKQKGPDVTPGPLILIVRVTVSL